MSWLVSWTIALALSCVAILTPTQGSADPAQFVALPDIPGGEVWSRAFAISGDGSVVVGQSSSMFHPNYPDETVSEAAVWPSANTVFGIGFAGVGFGFISSRAFGASGDGSVVVGETSTPTKPQAAFRWTVEGGVVALEDVPGISSKAEAVSADGSVVVGSAYSVPIGQGFRWTAETGLVLLGAGTIATDISADGSIIVGARNGRAVLWTDEGETVINLGPAPPPGSTTFAEGVSPDGSVVVGRRNAGQPTAWIWTATGGMVDLDAPPGTTSSNAYDVSNGGDVVVGFATSASGGTGAVMWDSVHGRRDLKAVLQTNHGMDLSDWHLDYALGVSDDGRSIVGYGFEGNVGRGWLAELATCDDGIDNDVDGLIDFPADPACKTVAFPRENALCQDGADNDGDGGIDFDGGASLNGGVSLSSPDPQCDGKPSRDWEVPKSCGLGVELVGLIVLVWRMNGLQTGG